jgi:hypothetical protein
MVIVVILVIEKNCTSLDHFINDEKIIIYIKLARLNEIILETSLDHFINDKKMFYIKRSRLKIEQ